MIVVKLQQHGTICTVNTSTNPDGYNDKTRGMPGGVIGNEGDVWAKENKNYNLWDNEW